MFVIYKYNVHFINKIPCFHDETFGHRHKQSRPTYTIRYSLKLYPKHSLGS
jgi:hypothetical protein